MFIMSLYIMPALWFGVLAALWLQFLMDALTNILPAFLNSMGEPLFLVGLAIAVAGALGMAYEQLHLRRLPHNLDAYGVYVGTVALFLGNQLDATLPAWALLALTSILIALHTGIGMSRIMAAHTVTAASSVFVICLQLLFLGGMTWLTYQVF